MKNILLYFSMLILFAPNIFSQQITGCEHKTHFFSRAVYSRGAAPDEEIKINQPPTSTKKDYPPSYQYFLFIETGCCGKIRIQSATIDGVAYNVEIQNVKAPVRIPNAPKGSEEIFIKESNVEIYQLVLTRPAEAKKLAESSIKHQLVLDGKIGPKTFSVKQTASPIRPLVAM